MLRHAYAILEWIEHVPTILKRKPATLNVQDTDGKTALNHAVEQRSRKTIAVLLNHKVDVNIEDNNGHTPLHLAILKRDKSI